MFEELIDATPETAKRLLGSELVRVLPEGEVRVRIVETELYRQDDAASHSYRGETPRTSVMFGPSGFAYVYFTYGMHYCFNVVIGGAGEGAAVLIRAVEPIDAKSANIMSQYRSKFAARDVNLCNGPAKLCQAMLIDKDLNGHNLENGALQLRMKEQLDESKIVTTTRIGISKAKDMPWRFYNNESKYVSKLM